MTYSIWLIVGVIAFVVLIGFIAFRITIDAIDSLSKRVESIGKYEAKIKELENTIFALRSMDTAIVGEVGRVNASIASVNARLDQDAANHAKLRQFIDVVKSIGTEPNNLESSGVPCGVPDSVTG